MATAEILESALAALAVFEDARDALDVASAAYADARQAYDLAMEARIALDVAYKVALFADGDDAQVSA